MMHELSQFTVRSGDNAAEKTFVVGGGLLIQTGENKPSTPSVTHSSDKKEFVVSADYGSKLAMKIFNNLADLKIYYSNVARYKPLTWQKLIFKELDRLLSVEKWSSETSYLNKDSFVTFMRFVVFSHLDKVPGLGVSTDGNVLTGWAHKSSTITAEFFPKDQATAVLTRPTERGKERVAWKGDIGLLKDFIVRFGNNECLDDKASQES